MPQARKLCNARIFECRIEALMAQLLVCGDSTLPLQQATSCSRLEWESRGLGSKLPMNSNVKAEVCVAAVVQGNAVEVERCFIRGRLGAHSLIPAVEVCSYPVTWLVS